MAFIKRLNTLVTVKRKTSTDIQPTGLLGDKLVTSNMIQLGAVQPQHLSFNTSLDTNHSLAVSFASNAMTISLKAPGLVDPSVGNPVRFTFRSNLSTSGDVHQNSVTGALSLTIPSGATLGTANGVPQYLWVYALDSAVVGGSGVELAVAGCTYTAGYGQGPLNTTAISSSASSGVTVYSQTARTAVPATLIGRIQISQATAGTWVSQPLYIGATNINHNPFTLPEYQTNTSSLKTPGSSGIYLAMANNSITLTPGVWSLNGSVAADNNGSSPVYTNVQCGWYGSNGSDSGTVPTLLSAVTSVTAQTATPNYELLGVAGASNVAVAVPMVRLLVTQTTTLYLVPYISATTPANARVQAIPYAERLQN